MCGDFTKVFHSLEDHARALLKEQAFLEASFLPGDVRKLLYLICQTWGDDFGEDRPCVVCNYAIKYTNNVQSLQCISI